MALAGAAASPAQTPGEYQVKAAFLYNFTKFIDWPPEALASPSDPFVLCVYGNNPLLDPLKEIVKGKNTEGRDFAVKRVTTISGARSCQVLFVGAGDEESVPGILSGLQGSSVLTVGELPDFPRQGGVINFFMESSRVRFVINIAAAERARLKISSKLLSLATVVRY
jgi:YfiR/HmsC-like